MLPAAVIGEWLTAILNSSMYTYEVSPVFTMYGPQRTTFIICIT